MFFTVRQLKVGKGFGRAVNEASSEDTFHLLVRGEKQYLQVGVVDRKR